ncbi:unnamed protein product [Lymnaea stagnalis]|uniref:adenosine deaminase n=1 Tax=Lymnaea stagnalis TaxID=6523 RepID=A0AAV2I6Q4_LYMST
MIRTMAHRLVLAALLVQGFGPVMSLPVDVSQSRSQHLDKRAKVIAEEVQMRIGGKLTLTAEEARLNKFIMSEKHRMIDGSRLNRTDYLSAFSFFKSKSFVETTPIFKIIKKMPKGAALHLHDLALTSLDWLVKNATYRDNVYMYKDSDSFVHLSMFQTPPSDKRKYTVKIFRCLFFQCKSQSVIPIFDYPTILDGISMLSSDPLEKYPTLTQVWNRFNLYFSQVTGLVFNVNVMRDYYWRGLQEFHEDNVQYIELRGLMSGFTELNGTVYDEEFGVNLYKTVTEDFVRNNPGFSGAKVIMSGLRFKPEADVLSQVEKALEIRRKDPHFLVGYDLVGQEDPNRSLQYYLDALLYPQNQLPYFFHAAETNWQETEADYNLVDALLLNTTRVGHGYGLIKHPKLVQMLKDANVAVEISPISNQILGLVSDLRNHPMASLVAQGFPIVVSSDDPGTWEAAPLSHDFYMAFMDTSGRDTDLTFLKQLALNSLEYSAMNSTEKATAKALWQSKWDSFITAAVDEWTADLPAEIIDSTSFAPVGTNTTGSHRGGAGCLRPSAVVLYMPVLLVASLLRLTTAS